MTETGGAGMGDETSIADERALVAPRPNFDVLRPGRAVPALPRQGERLAARPGTGRRLASAIQALPSVAARSFAAEQEYGNTFLFVPVFMAAGVLFYFALPHEPGFAPLALGAIFLVSLGMAAQSRPAARTAILAGLMVMTGMLAAKVETWRAGTQMIGSEITTRLTARVIRIEDQASGRIRLTLDLISTERPALRHAPQRIRITARSAPDEIEPGSIVKGVARLMPSSGPLRPDSYDFSFKSYFSGIGAIGFFLTNPELVVSAEPSTFGQKAGAWIEGRRSDMAKRINAQVGGTEGAIAAALITGIRAGIPEEINEALRIVGLYHVISISGLHMALVAGTLMLGLRGAFALAPSFSARHPVKKYAAFLALLASAFYLTVSGADIAAQRSFLMLAVMLVAVMFDRAALTMRNLAISAIVIILIAPHEVVGPSFQMSFAATAALVAAYAAWTDFRARRPKRSRPPRRSLAGAALHSGAKYAVGMSMTSVVAGLATALFTAWHFQQVSPLGLVANLAAMPFVSVMVMPMAVIAVLLMPLGLDGPPLYVMGQGIGAMNGVALWLAERSAFDATGAIPLAAVLVLTTALAILTMSGSALRWAAMPLMAAGIFLLWQRELPAVLVSEDAGLVAMRLADGRVAVNRDRPRAFTLQNWLRALDAGETAPPAKIREGEPDETASLAEEEAGFTCGEGLCLARHASGAVIVHASGEELAAAVCSRASLIVIDDATAENPCADARILVLTRRDLARNGSVEIHLRPANDGGMPRLFVRQAISEPYRPWHEHRRFSREARGLAPYQRRESRAD
ncbi:ComEC family competence protein [Aquamicrobium sp. LC103]|nr:ComEC family competence protein [Aquamicrobium sp. LC103]